MVDNFDMKTKRDSGGCPVLREGNTREKIAEARTYQWLALRRRRSRDVPL